jgi:multidrug resistance efflux pump
MAQEPVLDRKFTFADLEKAMADVQYANTEVKKYQDLVNSARAAMQSHEREREKAQVEVDRFKAVLRKVMANMEPI